MEKQIALSANEQQELRIPCTACRFEVDECIDILDARQTQPEHIEASAELPEFDIMIADVEHNELQDVSPLDSKTVEHLQRARMHGRLRLLRLRGLTLVLGSISLIGGFLPLFAAKHIIFQVLGMILSVFGCISLLMSLLPSDARCVSIIIGCVLLPGCLLGLVLMFSTIPEKITVMTNSCNAEEDDSEEACWIPLVRLLLAIGQILVTLVFTVLCVSILKKKQDAASRLRKLWKGLFVMLSVYAVINWLRSPPRIAAGDYEGAARWACDGMVLLSAAYVIRRYDLILGIQSWLMSRGEAGEAVVVAAGVASLIGAHDVQMLLTKASSTFMYVRGDRVLKEHMKDNKPNPELFSFAEKGNINSVDAFVSHSWHDDADEKWIALQDWIQAFKVVNKREPLLWIDKYCIDQNNIEDNLQCLPVYIAGCQRLLVLCGTTYLRRLWCIIEVYVFQQMGGDVSCLDVELLAARCGTPKYRKTRASGISVEKEDALKGLQMDVRSFDPRQAMCFTEYDTARLRFVVEAGGGGMLNLARFIQSSFIATEKRRTTIMSQEIDEPRADPCGLHWMETCQRKQLFDQAMSMGGQEGAHMLHTKLPARYWGITGRQFIAFIEEIRQATRTGQLQNIYPPNRPYDEHRFFEYGPNAHQATEQYIKPCTGESAKLLPYASYALAQNCEAGLDCDMFLSHAWDEGLFEFGRVVSETWPENCRGAYLCFLANPQHLDIESMLGSPKLSPFYRVLEARPKMMVMVSNQNCIIHSRLWCVFEAYCAQQFDIPVKIAGDPLWLIAMDKRQAAQSLLAKIYGEGISGRAVDPLLAQVEIDIHRAKCFSDVDKAKIWKEIGPHAAIVNMMLKELIGNKFME